MWETFISWYINNYLGQYVENLNSQQLSFALSQGELELENVPLKKNIFRSWGLPIEVKSGVVGRIKIEFNIFKYFRNEPVLISIEDIYLVAGPLNLAEWDSMEEQALAHEAKMSALDTQEARWKAQFDLASDSSSYYSSLYVSSTRIGASIVTKVVENLQLNVNNVHIRFEQEIGNSGRIIALGVTLQGLNVQSCDSKWNSLSSSSNGISESSFKTLQLNKFGIYCDTKAERLSELTPQELKAAMWKHMSHHDYLLFPVSAEARITKNNSSNPLTSSSKPRFNVHLTLEKVPLQLSDSQYKYSFKVYKLFRKLNRNCRLRHYRPYSHAREHPVDWWIYAAQAVLSLRGFKRRNKLKTWDDVLERARDNVGYVHAYQQHLQGELLSSDGRKLKDRLESELHFEDILELRRIAMGRVEKLSERSRASNRANSGSGIEEISSKKETVEITEQGAKASRSGLLSWMFPSWSGWTESTISMESEATDSSSTLNQTSTSGLLELKRDNQSETDFDEAILDDMKAFGRDALLAKFNFILNQGTVILSKKNAPFLELDFGGVSVDLSLKPRSGSHKFQMSLAHLILRDCLSKSSILAPHSISNQTRNPMTKDLSATEPLFNVIYEIKPNRKTGHRITVSTKPMDLILNPLTWEEVGIFFSVKEYEDYLEIPYNGYEAMKQKTKEELRVYWERLINQRIAEDGSNTDSSWEIYLDIFAPQIVLYGSQSKQYYTKTSVAKHHHKPSGREGWRSHRHPSNHPSHSNEDQSHNHDSFVVIDLGRFRFSNLEADGGITSPDLVININDNETENSLSDEDEEFLTPCSSPVPEASGSPANSPRASVVSDISDITVRRIRNIENFGDSLEEIHAKLYKKYTLEITDVQVVVVDGKTTKDGNWKAANVRGTSFLHLVDRFSINLQLERRLVYSDDPLWPALTLVGTLPKLTFHLNEGKVLTVRSVLNSFFSKEIDPASEKVDLSFLSGSQINLQDVDRSEYKFDEVLAEDSRKNISKLFVAEFTIQSVSVDLQSRGRNIAELQIVGTKTVFTRREEDTEFQFVIQSLLLADAVQTFGPDFQLLLASHRHVCMDTISGSLRDSEPTSPMSPVSPPSPMPYAYARPGASSLNIPSQLHDALLSSLQSKKRKLLSSVGSQTPVIDADALITADVVLTSKEEELAIITVQFNNLDIIANQETMVEILQFLQQIFPSSNSEKNETKSSDTSMVTPNSGRKIQANFEFHRLNVLLLRGVIGKDGNQVARKIATATASEARVNFKMNETLNVEGSLGGLQVINLTPEGQHHQRVLSVGQDPLVDANYHPFASHTDSIPMGIPQSNTDESALTFSYEKFVSDGVSRVQPPIVVLRMASVIYTHCSLFLMDLKKCFNQFQAPLANTLKSAATQIALGLVRQDSISGPGYDYRSPSGSLSGSLDRLDIEEGPIDGGDTSRAPRSILKLDVVLDSPVLVLPRSRDSPEVLVAHLGQISITDSNRLVPDAFVGNTDNSSFGNCSTPEGADIFFNDGTISYNVFICDISLYSLDLRSRWNMVENLRMTYPTTNSATMMRAQDLYRCDSSAAIPILHNTVIQFNISYVDESLNMEHDYCDLGEFYECDENTLGSGSGARLEIQGRVIDSLKVSLTPQQYSQLLDSISNIASNSADDELDEINLVERRVNWDKEKRLFTKRSSEQAGQAPLPSPTRSYEDGLLIFSRFEVPELIVELVLPDGSFSTTNRNEVPHLSLSCSDLSFKCDRKFHVTEMDICLKALTLEDTNADLDSWRRILAMSKTVDQTDSPSNSGLSASGLTRAEHFSKSCPDLQNSTPILIEESPSSARYGYTRTESSSLPEDLDPGEIFRERCFQPGLRPTRPISKKRRMSYRRGSVETRPEQFCPVTPPPSPRPDESNKLDNLVQIKIIFVDTKSPKFITKYGGNHKNVRVDFSTLEVLLTPDTFACLRRFFSDASKATIAHHRSAPLHTTSNSDHTNPKRSSTPKVSMSTSDDDRNTETLINVKALNVKLARVTGLVAEAGVNNVTCELKSRGKDYFGVEGRLGSLEVRDISPFCGLYPVKFAFQGKQALDFDYSRTGTDGRFRLNMSSIVCVHTNRFYSEFSTLWSSLFGQSAGESEASSQLSSESDVELDLNESTRVILDIQAGAPVLLFPYSSTSEKILVADLGHLSVRNKFFEQSQGLILNCISIDLIEMDLYSGELVQRNRMTAEQINDQLWSLQNGWAVIRTAGDSSFLQKQCALSLKVRRVFQGAVEPAVASIRVQGMLSTVYCTLDPEKYKLIRGLLAHNIGEQLETYEHFIKKSDHQRPNPASKLSDANNSNNSKLELTIELDLVNVTVEVVQENGAKLSRIDFIKSKFTFQNSSDGSKDVDLASQEILVCDSRFSEKDNRPQMEKGAINIFPNILQQSLSPASASTPGPSQHAHSSMFHSDIPLQAEIHFRQTQKGSNVTIVLNNMRLMLILDWWIEVKSFLTQEIPDPPKLAQQESKEEILRKQLLKHRQRNASPLLERSRELLRPVTVSIGIVTKRAPVLDIPESSFELKVNVSNCELVVVENASVWDTNAIILKSTAVMWYRSHLERPISCSLLQCELFSCILGLESETALSILDPTNIQLELVRQSKPEPQGISDATFSLASSGKILKVQSPSLSLRLSYHDMKMFVRLVDKFSKDAQVHLRKSDTTETEIDRTSPRGMSLDVDTNQIDQLSLMGFTRLEAIAALRQSRGSIESAVGILTLTDQANSTEYKGSRSSSIKSEETSTPTPETEMRLALEANQSGFGAPYGIEVKCSCLSVCVIDDCKDSDVPLVEISVQQLELIQNCLENSGYADCVLSGDYYNRGLSGWEPFLEPWKCSIKWKKNLIGQLDDYSSTTEFPSRAPEYDISLTSQTVMEISLTSTLLSLYNTVLSNWAEDYLQQKIDKRRTPFVPFALRNETGSPLWFCTILSNNEELIKQQKIGSNYFSDGTGWIEVSHGALQTFTFEGRGKLRHRNTHQLRTHQLAVRVEGWQEVTPVSVDRVGTYFRVAKPETATRRYGAYMELPPTRLVFEVSLQGSAQKLVVVRSALMIKNSLPDPVELKLENTIVYPSFEKAQTGGSYIVQVKPGQTYPIPLHSVWAHMWIRPIIPDVYPLMYLYCTKALLVGNSQEGLRECATRGPDQIQPYRFCVAVRRNEFPADSDDIIPQNSLPNIVQLMSMSKRANLVTLVSPFKIVNLLPHEISYELKNQRIQGRIAPGKEDRMTNVDTSELVEIQLLIDSFPQGAIITVNPTTSALVSRLKLQDTQKRTLLLTAKIQRLEGGVLAVFLSCPCWVVNKSGLPLLCKQEGTATEAAGQFQEHEVGRMVTPLMMSFADQEGSEALTFRVGTALHKDSKPFWCRSFLCQNSVRVRKLTVAHCNNRPESVYMVGVEIKNGTGRYRDTKLIIVSPRFLIDNRSSLKIQISQRAYATSFYDAKAEATHLALPAGCNLPFHWPRLDKEQLLCVRLKDFEGCSWSGGFPVDNVDSFHINIRNKEGECHFLRVEIVLQGPSYFVIFSDTTQLPPPFRIDNFSLVPVIFHQACVGEERLKINARSESSVPYALDEPTQPPLITVAAPGGTSVIVNMDELRYLTHLTYENFFYIAFTATFSGDNKNSLGLTGMETLELVLDVPEGTKVVLNKKDLGQRSQLWRVNADGLIEHEGSSPPRDHRKPQVEGSMLVLDIAGSAPIPNQCVPLMLRKPDKRRASTQHWEFTSDGRIKCRMYESLYVQAKDGFGTSEGSLGNTSVSGPWQLWSDVVLGPCQPICYIRTETGIPAEQAVARQKLRPGSGTLNLAVETDGPTRVLRIIDLENPPRRNFLHHTFEDNDYNTTPKCRIKIDLLSGLGISIVSCNPREELLYGRFSGLILEWTDTKNSQILKASVLNLQIDNQLLEAEKSAAIYVSSGRSETVENFSLYEQQPALQLYWESMKSTLNARVFKVWELVIKPLALIIEERLLLKLCMWLGFGQQVKTLDVLQESDFEVQKALTSTTSSSTRRYYFGMLKIILSQVRLSVLTTSKLQPNLAAVKRRLGVTLVRFEDANVELDPFEKHHPFETFEFLWALVVKHYRDELVSQAAVILGSTDFLGNPLGFVNDVSEGVSLMIYEGSVGALVKNVAHGLSNSAAKVTGTLGEGLGRTILDDKHEEERRRIKDDHAGSSGEYLYAGLKGLGHGLIGGVTSVVTQSYEGASNDGFTGLFTGFTKGIVGTITKPAVGVLDLATGAASAIRDSSRTSSRIMPGRVRPTRVVIGNGGLLPIYSEMSSRGQELLFELNDRNFSEIFIGCETLRSGPNQDLRIMISSEAVTVFRPGKGNPYILKIPLSELIECQIAPSVGGFEKNPHIELVRRIPELQAPGRPQVVCENEIVAKRVVQQVNYAKVLFEEMRHSQIGGSFSNED